jgi:DNA helicase-2/ATP-dependent DNA helicase PcrA
MKSESWTKESIENAIADYIENIPENPDFLYKKKSNQFQKGDLKEIDVAVAKEKCQRLRDAVAMYESYTKALFAAGRYDFEDMLLWVRAAFEHNPRILRRYQEQYMYILVDEFQDTNGIQNEILRLLASYWERPNLFAVGDDDQAIYEFQGARLRNIQDFVVSYKDDIQMVVLEDNYRSTAPILAAAETLISRNTLRLNIQLGIEKKLYTKSPYAPLPPQIVEYPNVLQEQADLILQIKKLRDAGTPLKEIGIIYSQHKEAEQLMTWLRKENIPYDAKRPVNVLDTPLAAQMLTILAYLAAEHRVPTSGDAFLYEILYFHFTNIDLRDIAKISNPNARQNPPLGDLGGLYAKIENYVATETFIGIENTERVAALHHILQWTSTLRSNYNNLPLPLLLEQILSRSGLLRWVNEQQNRLELLQILQTFTNWVGAEAYKNPRATVADIHKQLAAMREAHVSLPIVKTYYTPDCLTLTTAHSAKGLEFEHVFILNCLAQTWEEKRANRSNFWLPDTLTLTNIAESELEAARRLFFVAMTRAKSGLQISYSRADAEGKRELKRSRFIDEVLTTDEKNIRFAQKSLGETELADLQFSLLNEAKIVAVAPTLTTDEINGLLENYALSASALNRFLKCPLSFYYENVLKVPTSTNAAFAYGNAVHYALRRLYERMERQKVAKMPPETVFLKDFEQELRHWQARITPMDFANKLAQGRLYLPNFYRERVANWNKKALVERGFKGVVWQGVPLTGTVDKMENNTNFQDYFDIIDFKTGNPDNVKIDYNAPIDAPVWRQMAFYKILIENYRGYNWVVERATIDCVTPDKSGVYQQQQFMFGHQDMEPFQNLVKTVWAKIQAHDFYTGCGEEKCTWCSFTRRYQNTDALGDTINEMMDDV